MVVAEASNVTLKCAATGSPQPTITWRREGGEPISLLDGAEGIQCTRISSICTTLKNENFQNIAARTFLSILIGNHIFPNAFCRSIKMTITINHAVLSMEGSSITIPRVNRLQMGAYLCIASNGVPPTVSKRVMLIVHCKQC